MWEGDNLARYLIIDPDDSNILYLSTGIFDREALNSDCENNVPGGLGVLKSTDGRQTWNPVNNGLTDLYVGCLRMHPANSRVLFAAAGNNACSSYEGSNTSCGLFKTVNGGSSWLKVIDGEILTTVNFSPSNPEVIYAGSATSFHRSADGGTTWQHYSKNGGAYGPDGINAGFPIDVTVDPDDPDTVYVNNYGGGVFRSTDGVRTWEDWSSGYSGAEIHDVTIPQGNASTVYAIGRTGPFKSSALGNSWTGISTGDAQGYTESYCIALHPVDGNIIIISDEHQGVISRSTDGGSSFTEVLRHPDAASYPPDNRQGFCSIVFSEQNPRIVYAGLSKDRLTYTDSPTIGSVFYKSTDTGATFSAVPTPMETASIRELVVVPDSSDTIFAATTNGVYKTRDGGVSWSQLPDLAGLPVESICLDPDQPGYVLAGATDSGIWVSSDSGDSWTGPHNAGFNSSNPEITAIEADVSASHTFFAGDLYSGVYRSQDNGLTWSLFPDWEQSGLSVRAVKDIALNEQVIYAATSGGVCSDI